MARNTLGVGIVGVQPGRSWASRSHIPALRALSDTFRIAGIANSSRASAEAAAADTGIARAFDNVADLVTAPEVDIVTVAVKVPAHLAIVSAAIAAGKHVFCEWPLGNGLEEAQAMADRARAAGIVAVAGTQAIFAPEIAYLRDLIADGYVGEILSTTLIGYGGALQGGGTIPDRKTYGYLLDRDNGATLLTIPVGHALAALTNVLGPVASVSATLATRRPTAIVRDSGELLPVTAPDQVLISGTLANGAPIALHVRGGAPRAGDGLMWEINGTKGDLRVSGPSAHVQMVPLTLCGARGDDRAFHLLDAPAQYRRGWPDEAEPGNVARLYASMAWDIRTGSRTAPDFDDAVTLHRLIATIEQAASSGQRGVVRI